MWVYVLMMLGVVRFCRVYGTLFTYLGFCFKNMLSWMVVLVCVTITDIAVTFYMALLALFKVFLRCIAGGSNFM